MKNELKRILNPYYTQLEDAALEQNRIFLAQRDCIKQRGFNGCWNCDVKNEECVVKQTRRMIDDKISLIRLHIVHKVKDWLAGVE